MTRLMRPWIPLGLALGAATALAGCWHGDLTPPDKYPTRGKVVWHGQPVRFAIVDFSPTEPGKGALGYTTTGAEGTFETEALPGEYEVVLEPWDIARCGGLPAGAQPTKLPGTVQTGVVVEIKAQDNDLDVQVPDQPTPASDFSEGK